MSDIAIRVDHLSKQYRIGAQQAPYRTLRETLVKAARGPIDWLKGERKQVRRTFWALDDVSFEVKQGEAVGIIGRNGAGKSTLLKVLSRITRPTRGRVEIFGRVGSLLEVGTGFHPELTGRENVYLNGAILGMGRAEIARKFDEIVAFAEVEKFLDTPVKFYSSGMYVRLAFAVAANLEPEILVVDEVLAVGDAEFQKKCLGKMGDVARGGRTVLFVSHNMRAIKRLCNSAILLKSGMLAEKGNVQRVIESYAADSELSSKYFFPLKAEDLSIKWFDIYQNNIKTDHIDGSDPFKIKISFDVLKDLNFFRIGIYLRGQLGDPILRSFITDWNPELENIKCGGYEACLEIPSKLLAPGSYNVNLHASRYGIVDYLHRYNIEKHIIVSAPVDFNVAHMGEVFDSTILMKNEWQITRTDK
jgi:lipopolysaccharide transport system ATP-binding protein